MLFDEVTFHVGVRDRIAVIGPNGSGKTTTIATGTPGDLLRIIRSGEATTRAELAARTGLARSTIAQRIDSLAAHGLIREMGEAPSTGGRPPAVLGFNEGAGIVLAADLGATHSRVAVADLGGGILAETTADLSFQYHQFMVPVENTAFQFAFTVEIFPTRVTYQDEPGPITPENPMMIETQALDLYLRLADAVTDETTKRALYDISEQEKAHMTALGLLLEKKM